MERQLDRDIFRLRQKDRERRRRRDCGYKKTERKEGRKT
jgi:hypothetical protein